MTRAQMTTISLNHLGIAVSDLAPLKQLFMLLGLSVGSVEDVTEQGVRAHFFNLPPEDMHLELLEVTDPTGTVAKFLKKKGPGIHHLAFLVEAGSLDALCAKLQQEGYTLIYPQPRSGAMGKRVNFIHPRSAGGLLIEILEPILAENIKGR
jgi:methylmalonyl-CoA/ethylmalonyl-CoA epimerase